MLIRPVVHIARHRCAYVVACRRLQKAVVIDPFDGPEIPEVLGSLHVDVVAVVETRRPQRSGGDALEDLQRELHALFSDPDDDGSPAEEDAERPWIAQGVPWIRPVRRWASDDAASAAFALVGLDHHLIEVHPTGTAVERDKVQLPGDLMRGLPLETRVIRLDVGDVPLEGFVVPGRPDLLRWRVPGRVFTGQSLHTGSSRWSPEGTDEALLALPDATLLYPSEVTGGAAVATVAQERTWAEGRRRGGTPVADARAAWVPVVHLGGGESRPPIGRKVTGGFQELDPVDVLPVLQSFRIVDVRQGHERDASLPGAEIVTLYDLGQTALTWDRSEPVLVTSSAGFRCVAAAAMLHNLGFERVYRLSGGTGLWADCGLPVEHEPTVQKRASE